MKLLMYGAGNIGRGFIGALFAQSGYEVVFIDINAETVRLLNEKRGYPVSIVSEQPYEQEISNVSAVDGRNEDEVVRQIAECDIMATSLGAGVLEGVAPLIGRGFSRRMAQTGRPLDILICENLKNASHLLRGWIKASVPDALKVECDGKLGLVETAIGRMVPVMTPEMQRGNPLRVCVEEYSYLPVDKAAFVGEIPDVTGLIPYSPFIFFEERKLYLHNMGHALCAYLGLLRGHTYIYEAISDYPVRIIVQSAMTEAAAMLSGEYGVPFSQICENMEDLIGRFANQALGDTCERVARDPMRKLAAEDRFAGPLKKCWLIGIRPAYIGLGLASVVLSVTRDKAEASMLLKNTCGLTPEQADMVIDLYAMLLDNTGIEAALSHTARLKRRLTGKVI